MFTPKCLKVFGIIRPYYNHLRLPFDKICKILAQLRNVPLAEWSGKTAIIYQYYIRFPGEIGQAYCLPLEILQGEIWSVGME